eukprot:gnl/TRDRNA2_/TRDRNA2_57833_c0_seq1.p1 gnl/TRDRNA2_/TRDRNA2_57833_c0~~gnl/TRDRNA2_/TRDRNA2_57833_c0_seq1.p1  ORF type:complete len:208 (-),score=24.30 gnl/TRDRNA2_/TRDRNA2_57833_c0_seq1:55-642(-)
MSLELPRAIMTATEQIVSTNARFDLLIGIATEGLNFGESLFHTRQQAHEFRRAFQSKCQHACHGEGRQFLTVEGAVLKLMRTERTAAKAYRTVLTVTFPDKAELPSFVSDFQGSHPNLRGMYEQGGLESDDDDFANKYMVLVEVSSWERLRQKGKKQIRQSSRSSSGSNPAPVPRGTSSEVPSCTLIGRETRLTL